MPAAALAQAVEVDRLTQAQLLEKATQLESTAAANNGSAGVTLSKYPNHFTMLSLRKTNGGAEIHRRFADIFYIVRGQATLTTGGTIPDSKEVSEGEVRGTAVKGGLQIPLQQGDFVHIPAGVPHQLVLPAGEELVYFVIKIQEN
jgi:mannose-6-phosphate isomerase-like protein (cupin superfamily)